MEKAPEKTPPDLNLGLSSNGRGSYSRTDSNFGTGRYYFENLLYQCGELPVSSTTAHEVKSSSRRCESACTHTHKHHLFSCSLTHTHKYIYTHAHSIHTQCIHILINTEHIFIHMYKNIYTNACIQTHDTQIFLNAMLYSYTDEHIHTQGHTELYECLVSPILHHQLIN